MKAEFTEEHKWIVHNSKELEKHRGEWIAVYGNKLVASSKELSVVRKSVKDRALFFLVPRKDEENYILCFNQR